MFPDNADWLHEPDSNHDLDLLHRMGKLSISLQIWLESVFPLELTSAEANLWGRHTAQQCHNTISFKTILKK